MLDNRVWNPDGSCRPFNIETTQVTLGANFTPIRFRVPDKHIAVIDSYMFANDGAFIGKGGAAGVRVVIVKGRTDLAPTVIEAGIQTIGALLSVEELVATGENTPGFIITSSPIMRRTKICLDEGYYSIVVIAAAAVNFQAFLSGWVFSLTGEK